MQIFKAKKGNFWIYIILSILFPILMFYINYDGFNNYWFIIATIIPFFLFIWIYQSTKYFIDKNYFYYRSAFLKGKIDIDKIKSINQNKTLWTGEKAAMATKGMIITFGFDEIYVAPENNQILIDALLQINPNITVE